MWTILTIFFFFRNYPCKYLQKLQLSFQILPDATAKLRMMKMFRFLLLVGMVAYKDVVICDASFSLQHNGQHNYFFTIYRKLLIFKYIAAYCIISMILYTLIYIVSYI